MTAGRFIFELSQWLRGAIKSYAEREKITYDEAVRRSRIMLGERPIEIEDVVKLISVKK